MQVKKNQRVSVEKVVAIVCDKCGKRVDAEDVMEFQEVLSICFTGGYMSVLGDMSTFEADFCQHCVKDLLGPYLRERAYGEEKHRPCPPPKADESI